MRTRKTIFGIIGLAVLIGLPALAGPAPSKTAVEQSLEARQADLETVRGVLQIDGVVKALEAQGFTKQDVESRLAALSNEDLRSLAQNVEQLEAAGLTNEQWLYIAIGALIVLILLVV